MGGGAGRSLSGVAPRAHLGNLRRGNISFDGNWEELETRPDEALRERYGAVLMNPPFGESAKDAKKYIVNHYPRTKNDLYAALTESFLHRIKRGGYLAAITSRPGFFLSTYKKWREEVLLQDGQPVVMADLGFGVLNAMVETAGYVVRNMNLPNR